jgi:hypothetical protein
MLEWWRRWRDEREARSRATEDDLPFSPDEFAEMIRSGRRDDFRRLAAGLSKPHLGRR